MAILTLGLQSAYAANGVLTLDEYLSQVRAGNTGLQAASKASTGASERSEEGQLLLAPTFFGDVHRSDDERETLNPSFQGTKTKITSYQLGVSKLTTFGLQGRLYYETTNLEVIGANPAFITTPSVYDTRPVLELSQSLWKNFFGAETRAVQERVEAQALATSYGESYRGKQIVASAETAYWRLALARDVVRVQLASVERAKALRDWSSRQTHMQLADKSDFLQAEAALKFRQLDLQAALDEEKAAAREFNSIRGEAKDTVDATLVGIEPATLMNLKTPERAELRDDVKAAKERQRGAEAVVAEGLQRASPTLEVYGSVSMNGRDTVFSPSSSESFTTKHPWTIVGVRFSAPFDLGVTSSTRAGYAHEREAASLAYDRLHFEQEEDWDNLNRRLGEFKDRLKLSRSLEEAQREKLENERQRQRRGRSTTYQVILFEQDYASAQLARIRNQAEILQIIAQLKTFGSTL